MEFLENPSEIWKFKNVILSKTSIVDIIKEYGIKLEQKQTGQFTHRIYCPFHKNKEGRTERTPSMFIAENTNSFFCFGCGGKGSTIDFVRLIEGCPATVALIKLAKKAGVIDKDGKCDELQAGDPQIFEKSKTIELALFEISSLLRNYIKLFINTPQFNKELTWIEKISAKADEFLSNIGHEDFEYAEELCSKIKETINNRLKKVP